MSDLVKGYRTYLLSKAAITSLVSSRIYFGNLPQNPTYPAVVLHLVDSETQRHLADSANLARSVIQVDCHDDRHQDAEDLSEKIRLETEHYTGAWGSETVRNAIVTGKRDLSQAPVSGSQLFRRIRSLDVVSWHVEALPNT